MHTFAYDIKFSNTVIVSSKNVCKQTMLFCLQLCMASCGMGHEWLTSCNILQEHQHLSIKRWKKHIMNKRTTFSASLWESNSLSHFYYYSQVDHDIGRCSIKSLVYIGRVNIIASRTFGIFFSFIIFFLENKLAWLIAESEVSIGRGKNSFQWNFSRRNYWSRVSSHCLGHC